MTDSQFNSICVIVPLLAAQLLAYFSRNKQAAKSDEKANVIIDKANEIRDLADGNLSRVTQELKTANARIEMMEKTLREMNKAKDVADSLAAAEMEIKKQSQRIQLPSPR
jgi:hypothetical protein